MLMKIKEKDVGCEPTQNQLIGSSIHRLITGLVSDGPMGRSMDEPMNQLLLHFLLNDWCDGSNCPITPLRRVPSKSRVSHTSGAMNALLAKRPLTHRLAVPPLPKGEG